MSNTGFIRPATLAQLAAEIAADEASYDPETRSLTFTSEASMAAYGEAVSALIAHVGDEKALAMIDEAGYRA